MKFLFILFFICGCSSHYQKPAKLEHIDLVEKEKTITKPDLVYNQFHFLNDDDAKIAAEDLAKSLKKYKLEWRWQDSQRIRFEITGGILNGAKGVLSLSSHNVRIELWNLPEFLCLYKQICLKKIEEKTKIYLK